MRFATIPRRGSPQAVDCFGGRGSGRQAPRKKIFGNLFEGRGGIGCGPSWGLCRPEQRERGNQPQDGGAGVAGKLAAQFLNAEEKLGIGRGQTPFDLG